MASITDQQVCSVADKGIKSGFADHFIVSDDEAYICIAKNDLSDEDKSYHGKVVVCSIAKNTCKYIDCPGKVDDVCFDEKNNIVMSFDHSEYVQTDDRETFYRTKEKHNKQLYSYQPDTGKMNWHSKNIITGDDSSKVLFRELRVAGKDNYIKCILQSSGDRLVLYNSEDGKCIRDFTMGREISSLCPDTPLKSECVYLIDTQGDLLSVMIDEDPDIYHSHDYELDDEELINNNTIYVSGSQERIFTHTSKGAIKVWQNKRGDHPDYKVEPDIHDHIGTKEFSFGPYVGILFHESLESKKYRLEIIDVRAHCILQDIEFNTSSPYIAYKGASDDHKYLLFGLNSNLPYYLISVEDGTVKECDLKDLPSLLPKGYEEMEKLAQADDEILSWDDPGITARYDGQELNVIETSTGNTKYKEMNNSILTYSLHQGILYYLDSRGIVKNIRIEDGKQLHSVDLSSYLNSMQYFRYDDSRERLWYFKEDSIILSPGDGYVHQLELDIDTLELKAEVPDVIAYNESEDCWCCAATDNYIWSEETIYEPETCQYICFYPRYSLQELIDKGKTITKGKKMNRKLKLRYGI